MSWFRVYERSTLPYMAEPVAPSIAQLKMKIHRMESDAREIAHLMNTGYGSGDKRAIRAGELLAAIQRLKWELEPNPEQGRDAVV